MSLSVSSRSLAAVSQAPLLILLSSLPISTTENKEDYVQLPTSTDNVTLLAFAAERRPCSYRSISSGCRAHSSKPAAAACGGRRMGRTDGTDRRTLDSFIDPAPHTVRAVSRNVELDNYFLPRRSHANSLLQELHWLPVEQRITYELAVLTYKTTSDICAGISESTYHDTK